MKKLYLFAVLAVLVMGMNSCKYEEGPFISFVPKTERVTNKWIVNNAIIDGTQGASIPGFKDITFFKEGGATRVSTVLGVDFAYSGTWAFSDDKAAIVIALTDELTGLTSYNSTWTILHLKEDELKPSFSDTDSFGTTTTYIVTFEPAA
jgi:hypothetical protein